MCVSERSVFGKANQQDLLIKKITAKYLRYKLKFENEVNVIYGILEIMTFIEKFLKLLEETALFYMAISKCVSVYVCVQT